MKTVSSCPGPSFRAGIRRKNWLWGTGVLPCHDGMALQAPMEFARILLDETLIAENCGTTPETAFGNQLSPSWAEFQAF